MVALDDIRVRWRWAIRLVRAALSTEFLARNTVLGLRTLRGGLLALLALLGFGDRIRGAHCLAGELAATGLAADCAVVHLALCALRGGAAMRDDVVGRAAVLALAVRHGFVVVLWVVEDNVPRVNEAWEEAETAEGDVDERVSAAYAFLDPHCHGVSYENIAVGAYSAQKTSKLVPEWGTGTCLLTAGTRRRGASADNRCRT